MNRHFTVEMPDIKNALIAFDNYLTFGMGILECGGVVSGNRTFYLDDLDNNLVVGSGYCNHVLDTPFYITSIYRDKMGISDMYVYFA